MTLKATYYDIIYYPEVKRNNKIRIAKFDKTPLEADLNLSVYKKGFEFLYILSYSSKLVFIRARKCWFEVKKQPAVRSER